MLYLVMGLDIVYERQDCAKLISRIFLDLKVISKARMCLPNSQLGNCLDLSYVKCLP
jgi:hypothetical protein